LIPDPKKTIQLAKYCDKAEGSDAFQYVLDLEAKITELRAMLKTLEWSGQASGSSGPGCSVCGAAYNSAHASDCALAELLK